MWTEERIWLLNSLVAEGLSGQQIADKMGISRNAVIGKLDRLKGKRIRKKPGNNGSYLTNAATIRRIVHRAERKPPPEPKHDIPSLNISFEDLEPHHCRFICDNTYCGQPKYGDESWCYDHCHIVYLEFKA